MQTIIKGYRIHSTDINSVMYELEKVKKNLKKITDRLYSNLIAEEITFLVDQISINAITRDPNVTIYDGALNNVNERIQRAELLNDYTKYNLRIFAHIMPDGEYTYLKVIAPNKEFYKAFKDFEEYSLNSEEVLDEDNAKTKLWNKLHEIYRYSEPMAINLTQSKDVDTESFKFPTPAERADVLARHNITQKILGEISGGRELPPLRFMSYIDEALDIISSNDTVKSEYNQNLSKLIPILIDLNENKDIIFSLPGEAPKAE